MDIVSDASAFLAVVLDEESREWIIERTSDCSVVSPEVLPYEIANALIAVKRKGRLTDREVLKAFDISQRVPVKLVSVRVRDALRIAVKHGIHAYDAFYLQCCVETNLPLISLDNHMCEVARRLSIEVVT
ncbi:MAG TPA: type II toxin-antitoxin system VapC family toxin [Syntrophorhabdus sp.]|jgi:predicted nucleic acid-binding protein|nr:tRNA(fMet)-specific endonuclease VapC [Syntrophorhabdaceae bacterium]HNS79816.1 type II toxin-antitoxin system VapC family toxin [Syntrophorhabdus sp.]HNY71794.1 type II toxin-antitoxin system VapC family toxin [Syntrophorhabdus sp.]HQG26884.1 type II toxin-antitoxin system VapC family toxin [Syntrophorhabdus sp.]